MNMINHKFTFKSEWECEGKKIVNTAEVSDVNTLDSLCESFGTFLKGCGYHFDRIEPVIEDQNDDRFFKIDKEDKE